MSSASQRLTIFYSLISFILGSQTNLWANTDNDTGVIGKDERIQITESNQAPIHQSIGALSIRYGNLSFSCSGTVVGPRHVLTAAHCLNIKNLYPDKVTFYPGLLGDPKTGKLPFGKFMSSKIKIYPAYLKAKIEQNDLAMVIFDENLPVDSLKMEVDEFYESSKGDVEQIVLSLRLNNVVCDECDFEPHYISEIILEIKNKVEEAANFYISPSLELKSNRSSLRGVLFYDCKIWRNEFQELTFGIFYDVGEEY